MNHTPQIKKAIQFAARKHHGHVRLETEPLPYITHLFSTALLVAVDGAGDDVVCAALLHDVIEDTPTTREEIAAAFNDRVATLVETVSENKSFPWRERKEQYLSAIESGPEDALVVAIADKIDNVESKLEALQNEGMAVLVRWKRPSGDYLWYHGEVLRIAVERLPNHPLTRRLSEAHALEREKLET